jgi:transketolase
VGMAAGLALSGKIPFASTFAVFMTGRAYDQIRQAVCIPALNVKLCGSSCGLSDFGDGSTHQMLEDITIMRVLPNMTIISPGDARQTGEAATAAAAWQGPVYLRVNRNDMIELPDTGRFEIGKVYPLNEGKDITVFATGTMAGRAWQAANELKQEGISALVVNVPTIKPLDGKAVCELAAVTGKVLTCEEHSVIGGFGSAIAEALAQSGIPLQFMGIQDEFGQSANREEDLIVHYKLTVADIKSRIRGMLEEAKK